LGLVYGGFAQEKPLGLLEREFQKIDAISTKSELLNLLEAVQKKPGIHQDKTVEIGYSMRLAALYAQEIDSLNEKSTGLYNQVLQLIDKEENLAFKTWVYSQIGFYYYTYNQYSEAFTYFTKSSYALNQLPNDALFQGYEVLLQNAYFFQTITEYDTSIVFLNRALQLVPPHSKDYGSILNALGANYFYKKDLTSAEQYFIQTKQQAILIQDSIRYAKALGDLARVEMIRRNWEKAERLLLEDIEISKKIREYRNEMFAQLQLGKLYLKQGQVDQAKQTVLAAKHYAASKKYLKIYEKESTELLLQIAVIQKNDIEELQLRRALEKLHLQVKKEDKTAIDKVAFHYQKKSMEWEFDVQQIELEQALLVQKTWFLISFLLFIILVLLYILYKRRIKLNRVEFQNKLLGFQFDKMQIETKLTEANNSLDSFHTYIDSKNQQIGQLEKELLHIKNQHQKSSLENLLASHLMTDDNWTLFKRAFREEQPTYYNHLLTRFPTLTESNLRIILLQKMGLNNQEIGQITGITADAVKKAKQRLRKKYSNNEQEILDFSFFLGENELR